MGSGIVITSWTKSLAVCVLMVFATTALSGCSGVTTPDTSGGSTHTHSMENEFTTVNGLAPVGTPGALKSSVTVLDEMVTGVRHLVYRDTRAAGTRTPIHVHPAGGTTCLISGEMTLFVEGLEPRIARAGDCYWMPADTPMYGYASGSGDSTFFDSFNLTADQVEWIVVEPGEESLDNNFG